jgi:hypothetical protein
MFQLLGTSPRGLRRGFGLVLVGVCSFGVVPSLAAEVSDGRVAAATLPGKASKGTDFGQLVEIELRKLAPYFLDFRGALTEPTPQDAVPYRLPSQPAQDQVLLAPGLSVEYLTRGAANRTDQMAFFPKQSPTHLITCVEVDRQQIGTFPGGAAKFNPSIQRIDLATGQVSTILRGMNHCDGIRTTPWGTILATEETDDGRAYEMLSPLTTTEEVVIDRARGEVRNSSGQLSTRIAQRPALPTLAWEGLAVLANGVVFAGDEQLPGEPVADGDGGAIYKFIPSQPFSAGDLGGDLSRSPLVSGNVYAFQAHCKPGNPLYGQGCEVGAGRWIRVSASQARTEADLSGATGYDRPEDLQQDPRYKPLPETPDAVRFCWSNTGDEANGHFAEVMCVVDPSPADPALKAVANRFLEGDDHFNSMDNLEFNPVSGVLYVLEDHIHGEIYGCLRDGADRDIKSDGCLPMLAIRDPSAEPTGFIFSPDGTTAYLSIQHSDDSQMPLIDGFPTDDVLIIRGFEPRP